MIFLQALRNIKKIFVEWFEAKIDTKYRQKKTNIINDFWERIEWPPKTPTNININHKIKEQNILRRAHIRMTLCNNKFQNCTIKFNDP